MEERTRLERQIRRRRRSRRGRVIQVIVAAIILVFGFSIFFRVGQIEITGESRYTHDEIIAAAQLEHGRQLFLLDLEEIERGIWTSLPHAGEVEVRRRFPNRVEIVVEDTSAIAAIAVEQSYLIIDQHAKVLARGADRSGLIVLTGLYGPFLSQVGETLTLGEQDRGKVAYLQELLPLLRGNGLTERVQSIDMNRVENPQMYYGGRLTIQLGSSRALDHNMQMLVGILHELEEFEQGMIDLNPERPIFRPD